MGLFSNFWTRWQGRAAVAPEQAPAPAQAFEEEIPRYPPFVKGLPSAEPHRLVRSQQEMINKIRQALPHTDSELDRLVMPVIERYAAYVHLLPASQSHHHRGAGGLFRHGLEVGFYATQKAGGTDFCSHNTPSDKTILEPRWMLAAFVGGLLHDVGKPITDLTVTTNDGSAIWNPYSSTLFEWCSKQKLSAYYISWTERRNKKHERFALTNLEMILTQDVRSYLNELGPSVMEAMLEAIAGSSVQDPLPKLIMWADQQSTGKDMRQQKLAIDPFNHHVPVEKFLFDALARIAQKETVNEKGSIIWVTDQGVFLAWKQIAEKIVKQLANENVPGIPRDPATLATILIDKGFAVPRTTKGGKMVTYWTVYPPVEEGQASFYQNCLLIEDIDYVFAVEPKTRIQLSFSPPDDTATPSSTVAAAQESEPSAGEAEAPAASVSDAQEPPPTIAVTAEELRAKIGSTLTGALDEYGASSADDEEGEDDRTKTSAPAGVVAPQTASVPTPAPAHTYADTPAWNLIEKAITLEKCATNSVFTSIDRRTLGIEFPRQALVIMEDANEVRKTLSRESLLAKDVSGKWTHDIKGSKYLVLTIEASRIVRGGLESTEAQEQIVNAPALSSPETAPIDTPSPAQSAKRKPRKAEAAEEANSAILEKILHVFLEQLIFQGGDLIVGDVEYFEQGDKLVYRTSDGCLRKIAQKFSVNESVAVVALKRHPDLKHKNNLIIVEMENSPE